MPQEGTFFLSAGDRQLELVDLIALSQGPLGYRVPQQRRDAALVQWFAQICKRWVCARRPMLPMLRFLRWRDHLLRRGHTPLFCLGCGLGHCRRQRRNKQRIQRSCRSRLGALAQHDLAAKQPQDSEQALDACGGRVRFDLRVTLLCHAKEGGDSGL